MAKIAVKGTSATVISGGADDYISLTNNPDFNPVEFDGIRMWAGLNSFTLPPKRCIAEQGQGEKLTTGFVPPAFVPLFQEET